MFDFFLRAWPIAISLVGAAGVVAAILTSPGGVAFAAKSWREIVIGLLAVAALFFFRLSEDRAGSIAALTGQRDAAVQSANDWKAHADDVEAKAAATETAHAEERTQLINLARTAAAVKQGIANAPGASDAFDYSDAAYGVLRPQAGPSSAPSVKAPSHVVGR